MLVLLLPHVLMMAPPQDCSLGWHILTAQQLSCWQACTASDFGRDRLCTRFAR